MPAAPELGLDYNKPIRVADGIYWVGFYDAPARLHCNPYLVVDNNEAVLIDAGSRPDFSSVMIKVLDVIEPAAISAIILQHYDPDLCGSVPIFEEMIDNSELRIISHRENRPFIKHYAVASPIVCFETLGNRFTFSSGRELRFFRTPFAHSAGSFITFDTQTGVLFTSDLFGSYSTEWQLFLQLTKECAASVVSGGKCVESSCPIPDILDYHRRLMTSSKALRYAMDVVLEIAPRSVAPQHGSIIYRSEDLELLRGLLSNLDRVGIDAWLGP